MTAKAETCKYYQIDWVYAQESQIFQTSAYLTDEERVNLERVLEQYKNAGVIEQPNVFPPNRPSKTTYDEVLTEIREALGTNDSGFDDQVSMCQNCGLTWPNDLLINPIPDLEQRVEPGEPMPSGECPSCGALCQPMK